MRLKPLVLLLTWAAVVRGGEAVDFTREIRPILSNNCFKCHGPDEETREAELRLDERDDAVADRGGYRAIDTRAPSESTLLARVFAEDEADRMPPADSGLILSDRQKSLLRKWIEQGAHYEQHWSFKPVQRPDVPSVQTDWVRNPIDAFVVAALQENGIEPSPEADRTTLVRRVYLDVLGLPPSLQDVDLYLADTSADAYERMVDRALASPHYGERWGRHWLDQARYADTNGYSVDAPRSIWPYRDWVIRALNDDMPFDQFTIEQLAGDLLPNPTWEQLIATGFHRNTLINEEGGTDDEQFRVEAVVDRVNTTGAVWLGLTVACAQCHTHKFDPITQKEYYQLFAFFNNCEDVNKAAPTLAVATPKQQQKLDALDARIREMGEASATGGEELGQLKKKREELVAAIPTTMIMRERATPRETHVLERGDFLRKGQVVSPGTPGVLPALPDSDVPRTRLDLARWLVDRQNPLTARVTANRIWARYVGRGLVETENDFGLQGTAPTHPALLDWLAAEFMENGWSLKNLHRLILTSATYRQSSVHRPELVQGDPLNKLLGRQARLRVEAEIIRDLALSVSGLFHDEIGGPSVYPPQPADVFAFTQVKRPWPTSTGPDRYRRGMYTFFIRSAAYPMLTTFDTPVFNVACTFRERSNTPLQSLTMANDETMFEAARALGGRIAKYAGSDEERIAFAFRVCFSRVPDATEAAQLADYFAQQRQQFVEVPEEARMFSGETGSDSVEVAAAWVAVARVLLNLDEFITRE